MERSHSRRKQGAKNNAVKRRKQIKYKQRFRDLVENVNVYYGIGYIKDEGTKRERVKKISSGNKELKNKYNRKVRREKDLYQNSNYKKVGDYAWDLF